MRKYTRIDDGERVGGVGVSDPGGDTLPLPPLPLPAARWGTPRGGPDGGAQGPAGVAPPLASASGTRQASGR